VERTLLSAAVEVALDLAFEFAVEEARTQNAQTEATPLQPQSGGIG